MKLRTVSSLFIIIGTSAVFLLIVTYNKQPVQLVSIADKTSMVPTTCPPGERSIKANPTFDEVAQSRCGEYIGKQVFWKAMVSKYAHTSGIRFIVMDQEHALGDYKKHGLYWGTFLASTTEDPRETKEGLKNWNTRWHGSWVEYIMDVYGGIDYIHRHADSFMVTAVIDAVDCSEQYDGCYIEALVKKVEEGK